MNIADCVCRLAWSPEVTLPPHLRAFLACLAQHADWRTGRGLSGQARLARCLGVSPRTVRRMRTELTELGEASPVQVDWAARGNDVGRTSDAYQLRITESGQVVLFPGGKAVKLSGKADSVGHQSPQGSPTGDPPEDVGSADAKDPTLRGPHGGGRVPKVGGRARARSLLPVGWTPSADCAALATRYGVDVHEAAHRMRLHYEARGWRIASPDAALEEWLHRGPKPALRRAQQPRDRDALSAAGWAAALAANAVTPDARALRVRLARDAQLARHARRVLRLTRGTAFTDAHYAQLAELGKK